ncbi:hypothetical protein BHE74_00034716 [Ensete ventricosum]|nr:hypothetical protein GW17_00044181 [Ensete ventricosum]RWW58421.1 hypothetical protein BHE74_00034716 [Ensete ventricosum]
MYRTHTSQWPDQYVQYWSVLVYRHRIPIFTSVSKTKAHWRRKEEEKGRGRKKMSWWRRWRKEVEVVEEKEGRRGSGVGGRRGEEKGVYLEVGGGGERYG